MTSTLPVASTRDTLGVFAGVLAPTVAKGPIIRRPGMVSLAERMGLDRRAIERMQRLRQRYGAGPLLLRFPGQHRAVILSPEHVHRVLAQSPEPFATASSEKRAALAHFEPRGVLISHGPDRQERRRFNVAVLDSDRPLHRLHEHFTAIVQQEMGALADDARRRGNLTWENFTRAWFRQIRRVALGDGAREDHELTDQLARLRANANWAMLHPINRRLQARFFARLRSHLSRREPLSLAGVIAVTPSTPRTEPIQQVPQWLFAFDSAGIATFRALALLAAHPRTIAGGDRQLLRAALLESVRLWPTTPMVLRQTTAVTSWENGTMPAGTGVLIYAPFFHRDERTVPFANRFAPEVWENAEAPARYSLIPFSAGPAACPGRNLVLFLASTALATLLQSGRVSLIHPRLDSARPLPATLNHFKLRFAVEGS